MREGMATHDDAIRRAVASVTAPGTVWLDDGAVVAVHASEADAVWFCRFDGAHETDRVKLATRHGPLHVGWVGGLRDGDRYGLRVDGPWKPLEGLRHNPAKLLIDPYATRVDVPPTATALPAPTAQGVDDLARDPDDSAALVPKCIAERPWWNDLPMRPPRPRPASRVVYEMHAKGFTARHPKIPSALRGTLLGLAHPAAIEHLVNLGVTTVELMPLSLSLDERHLPPLGLTNYWRYNPIQYFAPDPRLAPGGMRDVAAAVDALHAAGIEVWLDVVFNHTAEGDERGGTLSFRGLDNRAYYRLADDPRRYVNDSGCGNTLALDRPVTIPLVMDALRHWATVGGIDGFRFDLAPVLGRTRLGFDPTAPLLLAFDQDPVLRDRALVMEPWDVGSHGYQLGAFTPRALEWNDRFRDDVRRFWRGDGSLGALATRLAGSSEVFAHRHRRPTSSVNFVTAHDGFTLADAVRYAHRCNHANGEDNRDGHHGEVCWASADPKRDQRALFATLLASRGTVMFCMGDELGRTQRGNNNAYCQDNELTWVDWARLDTSLLAFSKRWIAARLATPALTDDRWAKGDGDVEWYAPSGARMTDAQWSPPARTVGMLAQCDAPWSRALVWFHGGTESMSVTLPSAGEGRRWCAVLDDECVYESGATLTLDARSVTLLVAR